MVGRAAQGNPWALREIMGNDDEPSREEVVAELLLFIRETVRELGEHRATGFLKKFYAWYLARAISEAVQAGARAAGDDRGRRAAAPCGCIPGASEVLEAARGRAPGRRRGPARLLPISSTAAATAPARRTGDPAPHEPQPLSVSSGSTVVIVRECGAISSARPPVATTGAPGAASSSWMRSTIASTCPAKP